MAFCVSVPAENNILHVAASQLLGTLFSEYPAHRISNIAFSAAVRAYNTRNAIVKFKIDLTVQMI